MKKCLIVILFITMLTTACGKTNSTNNNESHASKKLEPYDQGYEDGYEYGHDAGYDEGYEDGKSEGYESGVTAGDYAAYSAFEDEFGGAYGFGYSEGYALLPYHKFKITNDNYGFLDGYMDGYGDGYEAKVSEIEGGKPFDYSVIPMMEVDSSFIDSVGYSFDNDILLIMMNGKDLYQYNDVGQFEFRSIMASDSPGEYFNENIKDKYEYKKVK